MHHLRKILLSVVLLVVNVDAGLFVGNTSCDTASCPLAPLRNCTPGIGDCVLFDCAACCTKPMAALGPGTCNMCWAENCAGAALITTTAPPAPTAPPPTTTSAPTNATAPAGLAISPAASAFVDPTCTDAAIVNYVEKVLAAYTFEGHVGQLILVWLTMALGQLAAIPSPSNRLGVVMWGIWVACVAFQMLTVVLSLALWCATFSSARGHGCLVEWAHGYSLLDVMGLMTSGFHPFVLASLALLNFHATLLVQAKRVWCVARHSRDVGEWWVRDFMFYLPIATFSWPLFTGLMWLGSLSFLFGFAFLPLALVQELSLVAALYTICWLHAKTEGSKNALGKLVYSASTFPAAIGAAFLGFGDQDDEAQKEAGLFNWQLLGFLVLAFLSPMVNNGAHLAFAVYSGAGTAATTALTGQIYATTCPGDLSFPIITDLDPAKALAAVRAVLAASFDVAALDTDALLASADGFLVLNVLVGLIKPFVSGAAVLLSYQDLVTKNVAAWKIGGDNNFEPKTILREQGRTESTAVQMNPLGKKAAEAAAARAAI